MGNSQGVQASSISSLLRNLKDGEKIIIKKSDLKIPTNLYIAGISKTFFVYLMSQ